MKKDRMHPTIEAMKAETLRQIRENRPQQTEQDLYVCGCCRESGYGRGWQMWHNCEARQKQGIQVRVVRRTV